MPDSPAPRTRVGRGFDEGHQLDREIADLETRAASAPTIAAGDPGAAMIAETLPWLAGGLVHPTKRDVQRVRILGLTTLPMYTGLLLGLAIQMRRA